MRASKAPSSYDEDTYSNPHWIVRWPHRRRIGTAVQLALGYKLHRILDYGAGDGYMAEQLISHGVARSSITLYEPTREFAELCAARNIATLTDREQVVGPFDCIICLSVLEHMPLRERFAFYEICHRALSPGGRIIIDVPVEIGPSLLVKAAGRILLKGRMPEYRVGELLRYSAGGLHFDAARFDPRNMSSWIPAHRGFDYRLFERELSSQFCIDRRVTTPLARLPPVLGQEVLYLLTRRGD